MSNSDNSGNTTRRNLLKGMSAVSVASATGLAGCAGLEDDEAELSEALELIQEGFEEEGIEAPFETTIVTNADNDDRVEWVGLIQEVLDDTEFFEVERETFEWGTYVQRILDPEYAEENEIYAVGLAAGFDPDAFVRATQHPDRQGACCNGHGFSDEELTELIDDGRFDPDIFTDHDTRRAHYDELQRLSVRLSGVSFVNFSQQHDVYDPDVLQDWETYPGSSSKLIKGLYAPESGAAASIDRDDNELVVGLPENVNNFDPINIDDTTAATTVRTLIYEGLTTYDFDGNVHGQLAEDWEQLDETTYRFHLREGVEFHNGEELTTDLIEPSWWRYAGSPREPDVFEWLAHERDDDGQVIRDSMGVEAIDDYTVEITFQEPDATALPSVGNGVVIPQELIDGDTDPTETPIGTGPYQFEEFRDDDLYRVESFDDHWFEGDGDVPAEPNIERVSCRIIREDASRTAALLDGDIDFTYGLGSDDVVEFRDDRDDFEVQSTTADGYDYVGWPVEHGPFGNAKVRRGVSALIPRDLIAEQVFQGLVDPAVTPVSPMVEAFTDSDLRQSIRDEELPATE